MRMKRIEDLLRNAEEFNDQDPVGFRQHEGQKAQEAWVLGKFADLLNEQADPEAHWNFAEGREDSADFAIFNSNDDSTWLCDVQVCEAMEPGYPRAEVYREGCTFSRLASDIKDPWGPLRGSLRKKAFHSVREPTVLLIYVNNIQDIVKPDEIVQVVEEIMGSAGVPYAEIWLLDSAGKGCRSVFPMQ